MEFDLSSISQISQMKSNNNFPTVIGRWKLNPKILKQRKEIHFFFNLIKQTNLTSLNTTKGAL